MTLFADGACWPNPGRGAWAYVLLDNNNDLVIYRNGFLTEATNNTVEIIAIQEALKFGMDFCDPKETLTIYSDSTYAIGCVTASHRKIKANRDLVLSAQKAYQEALDLGLEVNLSWVKGHSGNIGNNLADYYAGILLKPA